MWFKNYIARKVREGVSTELSLREAREAWKVEEAARCAPCDALLAKYGGDRWQIHEAFVLGKLSSDEVVTMNAWVGQPSWQHTQTCLVKELIRVLKGRS